MMRLVGAEYGWASILYGELGFNGPRSRLVDDFSRFRHVEIVKNVFVKAGNDLETLREKLMLVP